MLSNQATVPIVLVDDEHQALSLLQSLLDHEGFTNVTVFTDGQYLLQHLERNPVAVVVLDLMMPNISGITLLQQIAASHAGISVVVVTAEQQIETAIECMKLGAIDYLTKPIIVKRFMTTIKRAVELYLLQEEIDAQHLASTIDASVTLLVPSIITQNKDMIALLRYVEIVAQSSQTILITGETGVGKELFAQAIHSLSKRTGNFVSVNVAGLDDTLFSDTLFGHKKGSFTGAFSDRDGLIKKAAKGTLFLDEIGDLNELSQIKLLRLLQENEYYTLGSDTPIQNAARLVVATNQNLKQQMADGKFRKDLYYRLCSHQVIIPPLRNRRDDIPLLLNAFIVEAAKIVGKRPLSYRKELIDLLSTYDFPGNVRELQALVLDVVTRSTTAKLHVAAFKQLISREKDGKDPTVNQSTAEDFNTVIFNRFPTLKQAENTLIQRAMEITNNNQGLAAQMLGITRQALNNRLRRSNKS